MILKHLVLLASALTLCCASWNALRTTFGLNIFNKFNFAKHPETVADATKQGWTLKDDFCGSDAKFRGLRMWLDEDPSVVLLFDQPNGIIAGIQTSVNKTLFTPPALQTGHPWVDDGDYWTLTAYTIDPARICGNGRTLDDFWLRGVGDRLVLQNSTSAVDAGISVPLREAELQGTLWTKGKCGWAKGTHYFWNLRKDMGADEFFDMFLLYNDAHLSGFGFTIDAKLPSERYETVSPWFNHMYASPVPDFIEKRRNTTNSLHVYFENSPRMNILCQK